MIMVDLMIDLGTDLDLWDHYLPIICCRAPIKNMLPLIWSRAVYEYEMIAYNALYWLATMNISLARA